MQKYITKMSEKFYCDQLLRSIFGPSVFAEVLILYTEELYKTAVHVVNSLPGKYKQVAEIMLSANWMDAGIQKKLKNLKMDPDALKRSTDELLRILRHPSHSKAFRTYMIPLEDDMAEK